METVRWSALTSRSVRYGRGAHSSVRCDATCFVWFAPADDRDSTSWTRTRRTECKWAADPLALAGRRARGTGIWERWAYWPNVPKYNSVTFGSFRSSRPVPV